jgi:hypothetical protein
VLLLCSVSCLCFLNIFLCVLRRQAKQAGDVSTDDPAPCTDPTTHTHTTTTTATTTRPAVLGGLPRDSACFGGTELAHRGLAVWLDGSHEI